ncbi:hypothetical protein TREMEDRAFT_65832 [Tremella mesenterica DSM 1558]|uniref:uncharacterized protein n=1 Tax=Tremella mesenterica (strain ATCC 24925 / CBS 8224 / DSM 1558 / NBRC 9311 / NRRL Y-6157 / RJB 2259-6 / UBC 559-6) TaxID=578456 RepID=UPI00032C9B22|nr:uncharacterized protein TREMEDRAFT_65832 [Tremella mesenterica DSM 1558]EIW66221.1 hypothetical protein TREMEDRAFT_65832 [Tremella mesenterica DSM 1558]
MSHPQSIGLSTISGVTEFADNHNPHLTSSVLQVSSTPVGDDRSLANSGYLPVHQASVPVDSELEHTPKSKEDIRLSMQDTSVPETISSADNLPGALTVIAKAPGRKADMVIAPTCISYALESEGDGNQDPDTADLAMRLRGGGICEGDCVARTRHGDTTSERIISLQDDNGNALRVSIQESMGTTVFGGPNP